jgi:hypothetical protein
MNINKKSYENIKYLIYFLLPVIIAFYLTYPLLKGDYFFTNPEYHILKSFMINFTESLQRFELPMWNEYVESGRPSVIFGRYPIMLNTPFYMIFGYSDFTYYFARFIDISILFSVFIYGCRYFELSYMYALIGALVYFSVNFVSRFIIWEALGNLYTVYPILFFLVIYIVSTNGKSKKNIVIFSLFYILWLSGGYLTFWFMPLVILSIVYWLSVYVYHRKSLNMNGIMKFTGLYLILFIVPLTAVLYQYYFVHDVIINSSRLKEGYIVSLFDLSVWKHLAVSFQSSSYFWMGIFLTVVYSVAIRLPKKYNYYIESVAIRKIVWTLFLAVLLVLTAGKHHFSSNSDVFIDYISIINSMVFRVALLIYFGVHFVFRRSSSCFHFKFSNFLIFMIYVSLLSYYFYSPENIIGENDIGYDYHLFRDLSPTFQVIFVLAILFSIEDYQKRKVVKIIVLSLIALYLFRSHFTIPLMRFTGVMWYATRDGTIFSLCYAILFIYGLKSLIFHVFRACNILHKDIMFFFSWPFGIFHEERRGKIAMVAKYVFLLFLTILLVRDSYKKFYLGTSHRFIYPKKNELTRTSWEGHIIKADTEILASLKNKFLELDNETDHFYRVFSPENSYLLVSGAMQDQKIHEAFIYDCTIAKQLIDLYQYTILGKERVKTHELKDALPYFLFTRHVHKGINLGPKEIPYGSGGFYMSSAKHDVEYFKNQNIEFLWDLMQVKYLFLGKEFSKALDGFTTRDNYRLIAQFPEIDISNIYEITKNKNYSRFAVLPLNSQQDYEEVITALNSGDIGILKALYSKLVFLDDDMTKDFNLLKNQRSSNKRYYEIESNKEAILIDFESWNHSWRLRADNEDEKLDKAFQIFKAIKLQPGLNRIELAYNLKYFKELFLASIFIILLYVTFLVILHRRETIRK